MNKQTKKRDEFSRTWITKNALNIIPNYKYGVLTLRALYYQLVAMGMTNSIQHYKRVVAAMGIARRDGVVRYEVFSDHDRGALGKTDAEETNLDEEIDSGIGTIVHTMNSYSKNRWENQPYFIEIWIEKKALQGVFKEPCENWNVALCACKGYPSLTFLNDAAKRFHSAEFLGKKPIILYFGDYDATGVDIPRKIGVSLEEDFGINVEVKVIALSKAQVQAWNLPPAPSKSTDSRTASFKANGGIGQVELDAVNPKKLQKLVDTAIKSKFSQGMYSNLMKQQEDEKVLYIAELKKLVKDL